MIKRRNDVMGFLVKTVILCSVLPNIQIFSFAGTGFKPSYLVFIISIIYCVFRERIEPKDLLVGIVFLILPVIPLYRISNKFEWLKSYAIYLLIVLFFACVFRSFKNEFICNYENYTEFFLKVIFVVQLIGIIQFVFMNIFGVFFLKNAFGIFQFAPNQFDRKFGFYRAYSIFIEPSFFAWFSNIGLTVLLFVGKTFIQDKKYYLFLLVDVIALCCTISSSGLAVFMFIIITFLLLRTKNWKMIVNSLIVMILIFSILWLFTGVLAPIKRIVTEVSTANTSGYERLVTPFLYLKRTLIYYPIFGRGLGQIGDMDLVGTIGHYSVIHNGLISIIVCFGLSSLFYYLPAIVYVVRKIVFNNSKWLFLLIGLLGMYISTGAFCSIDTAIFLVLIISVGGFNLKGDLHEPVFAISNSANI